MKRKSFLEEDLLCNVLPFDILNNILPFLNTIDIQGFWKASKKFNQLASRFMLFNIVQLLTIPKHLQLHAQRLKINCNLDYKEWKQYSSSVNVKEVIITKVNNMVLCIPDNVEKCTIQSNGSYLFEHFLESQLRFLSVTVLYPFQLPFHLETLVVDFVNNINPTSAIKSGFEDVSFVNLKTFRLKSCDHGALRNITLPDYMISLDVHVNGNYFKMPRIVEHLRILSSCKSSACVHSNKRAFNWPETVYNVECNTQLFPNIPHSVQVLKCKHSCNMTYPPSLKELTIDKLCKSDILPQSLERLSLPVEFFQKYFLDVLFDPFWNVQRDGNYYTIISKQLGALNHLLQDTYVNCKLFR
jgi:hypothetical protein